MDLVRPSLYSFSIARQVGSGFSVRDSLMMYWIVVSILSFSLICKKDMEIGKEERE